MSTTTKLSPSVIPAQLAFLTIYNPSLSGKSDNLEDQIVYYQHRNHFRRKHRKGASADHDEGNEENNEKLRQVGLAQGMVEFARSFASGQAVDSVETERSRIILHELESGWWILASIDLTHLPISSNSGSKSHKPAEGESGQKYEYSAREVSPPVLLLQQLLKAHSIFLLHHGRCLEEIYERLGRDKFCRALDRFWTQFARHWDVLLHGNPSVDVFKGIKLAAGGELGIGVGEEEWGSGEREVLEGFVQRTEGLVELVVSRFGDAAPDEGENAGPKSRKVRNPMSAPQVPSSQNFEPDLLPSDGIIFSGTGALRSQSIQAIAGWMEQLYVFGESTYGVRDNPNSTSRRKQRSGRVEKALNSPKDRISHNYSTRDEGSLRVKAPPGLRVQGLGDKVMPNELAGNRNRSNSTRTVASTETSPPPPVQESVDEQALAQGTTGESLSSSSGTTTLMKYLTLGYGSSWGASSKTRDGRGSEAQPSSRNAGNVQNGQLKGTANDSQSAISTPGNSIGPLKINPSGCYLIGLQADLDGVEGSGSDTESVKAGSEHDSETEETPGRIHLRTVHVNRVNRDELGEKYGDVPRGKVSDQSSLTGQVSSEVDASANDYSSQKLRVVVYKNPPFIFTFLFQLQTPALAFPAFYRSLHQQLGPLHGPLLTSTSPRRVAERVMGWDSVYARMAKASEPIYDLVFDPTALTIHSTIPNIPTTITTALSLPSSSLSSSPQAATVVAAAAPWSRIEALNVHTQILNLYASTRHRRGDAKPAAAELEHTCKTSRNWWVVWMRLPERKDENKPPPPPPPPSQQPRQKPYREAVLIRKSSDQRTSTAGGSSSSMMMMAMTASSSSTATSGGAAGGADAGWTPGKLAEGIGIDPRRYIEGLWSLNR